MVLTIDIGNTNIVIGVFEEDKLLFLSRMASDKNKLSDEYCILLSHILALYQVNNTDIKGAIIASVVPKLTNVLHKAVVKATKITPLIVGAGIKTGLNIRVENPSSLGSDIVADAVAANFLYPCPTIIFDMGTATVVSVVEEGGILNGSIIIPGVRISLDALSSSASQLPEVSLEEPKDILGMNTVDSMKSGIIYGSASMIDGMIERLEKRIGCACNVVATGGLSPLIIPHCNKKIIHNENLLLIGLNLIYKKNT